MSTSHENKSSIELLDYLAEECRRFATDLKTAFPKKQWWSAEETELFVDFLTWHPNCVLNDTPIAAKPVRYPYDHTFAFRTPS